MNVTEWRGRVLKACAGDGDWQNLKGLSKPLPSPAARWTQIRNLINSEYRKIPAKAWKRSGQRETA